MLTLARSVSAAALITAAVFAKAPEGATAPVPPAPVVPTNKLAISLDIEMPEAGVSTRGGQSVYPFDELPAPTPDPKRPGKFINASFGVVGTTDKPKTAKSMASTVSSANKRAKVQKVGADGKPEFVSTVKDGQNVQTPVMIDGKKFKAFDVKDPSKDPIKATVRVFRIA